MIKILINVILLLTLRVQNKSDDIILIPHTHDDLGWLDTIQGYYDNKVKSILETTLTSLEKDNYKNNRKFVYSEIGYLKIFLEDGKDKREEKIERIKKLILLRKWEFVNGGMSQADSACPYYEDILENLFYGMSYLIKNFEINCMGGWQLDPFGHSKTLSYLVRLMGMSEMVVNRIGDFKKAMLGAEKNFTFEWVFPDKSSIRTHVTSNHYSSPAGMDCDGDCDFSKFDKNKLDNFLADKNRFYTYNPWYFFGNDFNFADAENNFSFIDQVLEQYDNISYGLFSDYVENIQEHQKKPLMKFDQDFFVYDESNYENWSGYYTTKPRLKLKIRKLGIMVRAFKHLVISKQIGSSFDKVFDFVDLVEDYGVFLHHDCITGTAKKFVDDDYFKRMHDMQQNMTTLLNQEYKTNFVFCDDDDYLFGLQDCDVKENKDQVYFYVYNQTQRDWKDNRIKFVYEKTDFTITVEGGGEFEVSTLACHKNKCLYQITDYLMKYSIQKFKITKHKQIKQDSGLKKSNTNQEFDNMDVKIEQNKYIVLYKKNSKEVINKISFWQIMSKGSGHYVLKYVTNPEMFALYLPADKFDWEFSGNLQIMRIIQTDFTISIVVDKTNSLQYQVLVQFDNLEIFEKGIDLVMKVENQKIKNNGKFETDSNGLFQMQRTSSNNFEHSVYPFTQFAKIKHFDSDLSLTVFTEKSQGAISFDDGSLIVYLERSASQQDNKGNDEILSVDNPFLVWNIIANTSSESEWENVFYENLNLFDNQPLQFYSSENLDVENLKTYLESSYQIPEELRINVDFVEQTHFIFRVQNIHRTKSVELDIEKVFETIYGKILHYQETCFEEFFGYRFFEPSGNIMKPLQFKLFYVKF